MSQATLPQHLLALDQARETRRQRAALHRRVDAGEACMRDVLAAPPRFVASMTIEDLLQWQRQWGTRRAGKLLGRLHVKRSATVRSLTTRQRVDLINELHRMEQRDQARRSAVRGSSTASG